MRDPYLRINKYAKKITGPHLGKFFKKYSQEMIKNYSAWVEEIYPIEEMVKNYLNEKGVPITHNFFYLAFAREIFSLKKRFGGIYLLQRAQVVLEKWIKAGLNPEILNTLKENILSLQTPPINK